MWLGTVIGGSVVVALGAGLWLGGETVAANRMRETIAQSPVIAAQSVQPLRQTSGPGLRLDAPVLQGDGAQIALPWAVMSLSPLSPTRIDLRLPPEATLTKAGHDHKIEAGPIEASIGVSPLRRMVVDGAEMRAADIQIDGLPLAGAVSAQIRLVSLGHDAPRMAISAYDLDLAVQDLGTEGLAVLGVAEGLPDDLSVTGQVRLWLDGPIRATAGLMPQVVGGQTDGVELRMGQLRLRIIVRVAADAEGRAEGRAAMYTSDAEPIIEQFAALGLIPAEAVLPIRLGLSQLGRAEFTPVGAGADGPDFPAAAEGELRLPLEFRDGRMMLGQIPLGPAPVLLR